MVLARETIYEALLSQLKTAGTTFKTYSRRWRSAWDDPAGQISASPMLIQWEASETVIWSNNRGIGSVRTLSLTLEVYAKIPDGMTPGVPTTLVGGSATLNPLLDAIETALAPDIETGLQTLGGLVTDCRIDGTITKVLGDEDPSGLCGALIPVSILMTV